MSLRFLAAALQLAVAAPVGATIIDFENEPANLFSTQSRPSPYTNSGFRFTSSPHQPGSPFFFWAQSTDLAADPDGHALVLNGSGIATVVTKVGGGTFTLNSLKAADVYNNRAPYYDTAIYPRYEFAFTTAAGTTLQTVTLADGVPGLELLTFNRPDLLSFSYRALNLDPLQANWSPALQVDDIVLDAPIPTGGVPEPASWALLIVGFGLTGASARRRRRAVAA